MKFLKLNKEDIKELDVNKFPKNKIKNLRDFRNSFALIPNDDVDIDFSLNKTINETLEKDISKENLMLKKDDIRKIWLTTSLFSLWPQTAQETNWVR